MEEEVGCIYKVPSHVTEINKKAYKPQARSNKPLWSYVEALSQVSQELKDSYWTLDLVWQQDTNAFLQLMIRDGCFMLETLRIATQMMNDYATNDLIFNNHETGCQFAIENEKVEDKESINKLILKFCNHKTQVVSSMDRCLHVLDCTEKAYYGKTLNTKGPIITKRQNSIVPALRRMGIRSLDQRQSSMKLESGSRKVKPETSQDISFKGGILRLPPIVVDDTAGSMFLNQIAFERFHVGAGNEVTSYIFFMDNIIDTAKDVSLLQKQGIIQNAIRSDKAVAELFNSLSKYIMLDPESSLDVVHKIVHKYCKKPWTEWRANLIHTYFRSPWAILSVIAAVFLFALTII
ncbi:hypothetical protein LguiA_020642 [Lonicera macranthoides]